MRRLATVLAAAAAFLLSGEAGAAEDGALRERARALFAPIPTKPPELPGNPASVARVELGPAETEKVAAFLVSLTGRQPSIVLPVLPPSGPSTPRPKL